MCLYNGKLRLFKKNNIECYKIVIRDTVLNVLTTPCRGAKISSYNEIWAEGERDVIIFEGSHYRSASILDKTIAIWKPHLGIAGGFIHAYKDASGWGKNQISTYPYATRYKTEFWRCIAFGVYAENNFELACRGIRLIENVTPKVEDSYSIAI